MEEVVERGLAVLKHNWEESTPGEKAVIAGLTSAMGERNRPVGRDEVGAVWRRLGVALPEDEAARAMKSLAARDILSGDDQVKFTVDLVHFWVRKFQRLEWVKDEIQAEVKAWTVAPPAVAPAAAPASVQAAPSPAAAAARPNRRWLLLGGAGLLVILVVLVASILDWGPFESATQENVTSESGLVVPGGDALLVNDLAVADGAVWAATEAGLVRWAADGQALAIPGDAYGFPEPANQTLAVADDGTLWVGGGGVSHVEPTETGIQFLDYYDRDSELGMGVVRELMVDTDQSVWAGGNTAFESPLSRFDGEAWDYNALSLAEPEAAGVDPAVWSLLRDFDGNLWIGLISDGILRWDGENWTHWGPEDGVGGTDEDEDTRVRGLVQDDRGNIWAAAGYRGLLIYVPDTDSWEAMPVDEITDWVTAVAFFEDTSLWVGQEDGTVLRSFDYGDTWDVIAGPDDGLGVDITAFVRDGAGNVFVSSYGGGVSVYDLYDDSRWIRLQQ
jgi:ligand-binding sensor domain-containing protein